MGTNFLESLGEGDYSTSEGTPSASNKKSIDNFKNLINAPTLPDGSSKAWDPIKKSRVKGLLSQIEIIISQNRSATQLQLQSLGQSENIIKKEIEDLKVNNTTLTDLLKEKIDQNVQNVANQEYAEFYETISEYNYRLAIVGQIKAETKNLLLEYDNDMEIIQNYISALV